MLPVIGMALLIVAVCLVGWCFYELGYQQGIDDSFFDSLQNDDEDAPNEKLRVYYKSARDTIHTGDDWVVVPPGEEPSPYDHETNDT